MSKKCICRFALVWGCTCGARVGAGVNTNKVAGAGDEAEEIAKGEKRSIAHSAATLDASSSIKESSSASLATALSPLVMFVFAMPLTGGITSFDTVQEAEIIKSKIKDNNKHIRFEQVWSNFVQLDRRLSERAPTILHFSGHGAENGSLVIEGARSEIGLLNKEMLTTLITSESTSSIRLVIINACYSDDIATAFVSAGVQHVVACKGKIIDFKAKQFAEAFYDVLFSGQSVKAAFEKAVVHLASTAHHSGKDDSIHGQFVLLPSDGDHHVSLFKDTRSGKLVDETARVCRTVSCEPTRDQFSYRNNFVAAIYSYFAAKKRIVTVYGVDRGIGSSQVAVRACHYLSQRPLFSAIVQVKFRSETKVEPPRSPDVHASDTSAPAVAVDDSDAPRQSSVSKRDTMKSSAKFGDVEGAYEDSVTREAMYRIWSTLASVFPDCVDRTRRPTTSNIETSDLVVIIKQISDSLSEKVPQAEIDETTSHQPQQPPRILLFLDDCNAYLTPVNQNTGAGLATGIGRALSDPNLTGSPSSTPWQGPPWSIPSATSTAKSEASLPPVGRPPVPPNLGRAQSLGEPIRPPSYPVAPPEFPGPSMPSFLSGSAALGRFSLDSATSASRFPVQNATSQGRSVEPDSRLGRLRFQASNPIYSIIQSLATELPNVSVLLTLSTGYQLVPPQSRFLLPGDECMVTVDKLEPSQAFRLFLSGFRVHGFSQLNTPTQSNNLLLSSNQGQIDHRFIHSRLMTTLNGNCRAIDHFMRVFLNPNHFRNEMESEDVVNCGRESVSYAKRYENSDEVDKDELDREVILDRLFNDNIKKRVGSSSPVDTDRPLAIATAAVHGRMNTVDYDIPTAVAVPVNGSFDLQDPSLPSKSGVYPNEDASNACVSVTTPSSMSSISTPSVTPRVSAVVSPAPTSSSHIVRESLANPVASSVPFSNADANISTCVSPTSESAKSDGSPGLVVDLPQSTSTLFVDDSDYSPSTFMQEIDDFTHRLLRSYFDIGPTEEVEIMECPSSGVSFASIGTYFCRHRNRCYSCQRTLTIPDLEFLLQVATTVDNGKCPRCDIQRHHLCKESFIRFAQWWKTLVTCILVAVRREFESEQPILLHGFVSRSQADAVLSAESVQVGTFLIRISERKLGKLVLVVKRAPNEIRHILISVDAGKWSLAGNPTQYTTLSALLLGFGATEAKILFPNIPKEQAFGRLSSLS